MTLFLIKGLLFSVLLIDATLWDLKKRLIPDHIPLLILAVGLVGIRPLSAFMGLLLTGLPYLLAAMLAKKQDGFAIGGGDVKLMAACGFTLGISGGIMQSIVSLALALICGAIWAAIRQKPFNQIRLPLAPFFCVGGILSYAALFRSAAILF